ncbi:MAG: MATE family efflux transporter [Bulleidia sp.]
MNKLESMKMSKLVFQMSLPLMVSLLVQSLYNIVDSIFVARISEEALTATSLAYPVQVLMIAFSVGTSVGINALLSKSIGAKQYDQTKNIATMGIVLALSGTVVFMFIGLFFSQTIVSCFTDDLLIRTYCQQYLWICMVFCAGSFISTMVQRFLQSVGDTVFSMISLICGAVTNIILDPVFIFGMGMGIQGAAIATVIGQWISAVTAIVLNMKKNPYVHISFRSFHWNSTHFIQIYKVGLPTIITQALGSFMITCVNSILLPFSTSAVAFFGVYYKLQNFLFMPMNGLGQAAIPIAGFNYGAKNYVRIRELLKTIIPVSVVISLAATLIFLLFPQQLLQIFSAGETMMDIGVPALRIISPTFVFASITMILGYTVSGLGSGFVNMAGTCIRQFVVLIPCIYLLAEVSGIHSVWYAFWISEVLAALYAVMHTKHILKQKGII